MALVTTRLMHSPLDIKTCRSDGRSVWAFRTCRLGAQRPRTLCYDLSPVCLAMEAGCGLLWVDLNILYSRSMGLAS